MWAWGGFSLAGNDESPVETAAGGRLPISGVTNDKLVKKCRWNRNEPNMKLDYLQVGDFLNIFHFECSDVLHFLTKYVGEFVLFPA